MAQNYTIFTKGGYLTIKESQDVNKMVEINERELNKAFVFLIRNIVKGNKSKRVVRTYDAKMFYKKLCKKFTTIKAGGGIVEKKNGEFLLIKRNGKWDIAKGKLDKGEDKFTGAVREVEEECGIKGVEIKTKLITTTHAFIRNGYPCLKKIYWFTMKCKNTEGMKPQTEEGITDVRFVTKDFVERKRFKTFATIEVVLKAYFNLKR